MKFFLDTANIDHIKEINEMGVLDGVTTNPTLIAQEGRDFHRTILEICEIVNGPVSAEVIATQSAEMIEEAKVLSGLHDNVVVKIPFGPEGLKATRALYDLEVDVNMTLVFSSNQALLAARAGAILISPFVGRLDDIGQDGIEVAKESQEIVDLYEYNSEIIAASIRHPRHVQLAAKAGIDIATVPYKVFYQIMKHPLTDLGLQQFLSDWEKVNPGK